MTKDGHKNPPRLYGDNYHVTHPSNLTEAQIKEAEALAKAQEARTRYIQREGALTRRNLNPVWLENARILIKMYKQCGCDLSYAASKFIQFKKDQGWKVSQKYVYALMQYVREKLALAGQAEAMLEESAQDLQFARQEALQHLAMGDVDPILKVVSARSRTFNLPKYFAEQQKLVVNINNTTNSQNVMVGRNKLEDYLARLPADKREAVRQLALEYRKDGEIPASIEMKGDEVIRNHGE